MKKIDTFKIILYVLGSILIIQIIFAILVLTNNIYVTKKVFVSDDEKYKIIIRGNNARWPFGPEDVIIYAKNKWSIFKYKTKIFNDGKKSNENNYNVEWKKDKAYVTLSGEEQDNEDLVVDFKTKTIKHRKMKYKVVKVDEEIKNEYFEDKFGKSEVIFHNIRILDENGMDILPYKIETFIRTLNYEREEGITKIKWYDKGNATIYKNSDVTLIDCPYHYNNRNNEEYKNVSYNSHRYIVAPSNFEYKYVLCITK